MSNPAFSDEVWSPGYVTPPVLDYPDPRDYPAETDIPHCRAPGMLMRLCRWGFSQSYGYLP